MTDLDQLTADHGATIERLDAHEKAHRKQRRAILIALVTAFGGGVGTSAKAYFDYRAERDAIQADAQVEATGAELEAIQWEESSGALRAMDHELAERAERIAELETRIAKAEVAIELDPRQARRLDPTAQNHTPGLTRRAWALFRPTAMRLGVLAIKSRQGAYMDSVGHTATARAASGMSSRRRW